MYDLHGRRGNPRTAHYTLGSIHTRKVDLALELDEWWGVWVRWTTMEGEGVDSVFVDGLYGELEGDGRGLKFRWVRNIRVSLSVPFSFPPWLPARHIREEVLGWFHSSLSCRDHRCPGA